MLDREYRGAGAGPEIDLVVHAGQMVLDGARREDECFGDLAVAQSTCQDAQHVDLSVGEVVRPRGAPPRQSRRLDDRADRLRVETARADLLVQRVGGVRARVSRSVGTRFGHRREHVGGGEQPTATR